jgi:DNA-binding CsgD family transcriptional regulator
VGLLLEGPAGIGKTTLWQAGLEQIPRNKASVILARPSHAEQQLSYSGLRDLVRGMLNHDSLAFSRLAPHVERAVRSAVRIVPPTKMPIDALTVAAGVRDALVGLAEAGPVVVAIDDIQWLDDASATVLTHVLRRSVGAVSLLLTRRTEPDATERLELPDWVERLVVKKLKHDAVLELLASRWERGRGTQIATTIAEISAGSPFVAIELIRVNLHADVTGPAEVPMHLAAGHADRIRQLSADSRETLLFAALCSQPTLTLLAAAVDAPAEAVAQLVLEAVDAGVAEVEGETVRFCHPLYASSAITVAGDRAARSAHAELATLSSDPEQIAVHLDAATIGPNDRVAEALFAAARSVLHRGATSAGESLARRAFDRAEGNGAIRSQASVILAEAKFLRGDLRGAERMLVEALDRWPDAPSADARIMLFRVIFEQDFTRASTYLDEAIAVTERGPRYVDLLIWKAQVLTGELRMAEAEAAATEAHQLATDLGDPGLLAETAAVTVVVAFLAGHGFHRKKLVDAVSMRDPTRPWQPIADPLLIASLCHNWVGEHQEAVDAALALAVHLDLREPSLLDGFTLWAGVASACALGQSDVALRLQHRSSIAGETGVGYFLASSRLSSAYLNAYSGHAEGAIAAVNALIEATQAIGMTMPQMPMVTALPLALALNINARYDEVDARVGPLARFAMAVNYPEPGVVAWIAEWAEALVALGRVDEAIVALDWLGERADALERVWVQGLVARGRAHVALRRGELDEAVDHSERAVKLLSDPPNPFEVARSQLFLGNVLRQQRRRRDAAVEFTRALDFFERSGLSEMSERTRAEIRRVAWRPAKTDELTASEHSVAVLAAAGRTNREIAAQLYVNEKTVEAHLSRAFRKLGVRRRIDLRDKLPD